MLNLFARRSPPAPPSALSAKERLRATLTEQRAVTTGPEYLRDLHREVMVAIGRYVRIGPEDVSLRYSREAGCGRVAIDFTVPDHIPRT